MKRWPLLVALLLGGLAVPARAQLPIPSGSVTVQGFAKGTTVKTGATVTPIDANHNGVDVNIVGGGGGGGGGTSSTFGAAFPGTGTASGFTDGTNMQGGTVFDLDTGAGTQYVLGASLRLSAGGGSVEGGTLANPIRVDPTGTTPQPVSGTVAATQSGAWTVAATQSGAWSVGRTWSLSSGTDSVAAVQSGAWSTGRTWTLSSGTDSIATLPPSNASTNVTQWNSVALGSPSAYGTSPGAVTVPGVNAFITNIPHVITDTGSETAATLSAETTKVIGTVRMLGNAGAIVDAPQNTATPANNLAMGCNFTTSPATITTGNLGAVQCNSKGEPLVQLTDGTTNVSVIAATNALKTDLSSVAGTATVTAAAGVAKVGIVGNANGAIDAANNAAAPANVLVAGVETIAQGTQPTAATTGNVRRMLATTEGVLFVQEGNSNRFSCFVQAVTATTQCQAAPAAGLRAYVTSAHFSNQAATVQTLDIVFGTGANCVTGTTALTHKWQMGTLATTTSPMAIEANFFTPLIPTAANAICVRPSAATAFGATLTGFIAP